MVCEIEKRGVGEEFVGSYLYQVHLCPVSSPTITGGSLSGNNAYIKVKLLFAGCPLYRSTSKLNGIFAQHFNTIVGASCNELRHRLTLQGATDKHKRDLPLRSVQEFQCLGFPPIGAG